MAPEQFEGGKIDQRADIYALGVLAFEMFTGNRPFKADNLVQMAFLHSQKAPPNPLELNPNLPPRLTAVILRCLEKEPDKRFGTVLEIISMISDINDQTDKKKREIDS